jgi:hypothetical protein
MASREGTELLRHMPRGLAQCRREQPAGRGVGERGHRAVPHVDVHRGGRLFKPMQQANPVPVATPQPAPLAQRLGHIVTIAVWAACTELPSMRSRCTRTISTCPPTSML